MRFEIFRSANAYAFRLLNADNQLIFTSIDYATLDDCIEKIREFAESAANHNNYNLTDSNQKYYFTVSSNGNLLGRSIDFSATTEPVVTNLIQNLTETVDYEVVFTETQTRTIQRPVIVINENSYNFSLVSFSGKPGFDAFQNPEDKQYYFLFNDTTGKAFLFSQRYASENSRNNGIRAVIQNAGNEKRYEIFEETGKFYFILKASNGKEIARSRMFDSRNELESAMAYLKTTADNFEETYKKPEPAQKREKSSPSDSYKFNVKSKSGIAGFEPFENTEDKQLYFHFNNAKGKAILFSQSYGNAAGRDNGIKSVIKNAYISNRYVRQEEDGKFYFILKAGNSQEIARSPLFNTKKEMEAAIAFLQEQAVTFAEKYKVELKSEEIQTAETRTFNIHIDRPKEIPIADSDSERSIDEYDFTQLSQSGKKGFESFQSEKNGKFYFHFNDEAGNAILYSESYPNAKVRDNGIKSVIKNAGIEKRWQIVEKDGKYYYSLFAGNHQEIARGPLYDDKEKMLLVLAFLQNAGGKDETEPIGVVLATPEIEEEPAVTIPPVIDEEPEITSEEVILTETPISLNTTDINPVAEEPVKMLPIALDIINGAISGRAGAVNIKPLEGRDKDGNITGYTIVTLPAAEKGTLLLSGNPVVAGQVLSPAEARLLQFDPSGKSSGNAVFSYKTTDNEGLESNTALFTIPVMNVPPVAKNITFSGIKAGSGTVKIEPLAASDSDGKIEKFIITSLPAASQGTLLFKNMPVKEQQELIPAEVSELYFLPKPDFSGEAVFQYKVQDSFQLLSNIASYTIPVEKQMVTIIPPILPVIPTTETEVNPSLEVTPPETMPLAIAEPEPIPIAQQLTQPVFAETKPVLTPLAETTATTPSEKASGGLLPWLIGGAAVLALGLGLWWMMNNKKDTPTADLNADTLSVKKTEELPKPEKEIPAPVTIENFQPINLYFNNDQPNPRSEDSKTNLTYGQTYQAYYGSKSLFAKEYSKGLNATDGEKAGIQVGDFFDGKVKKGYEDLIVLSDRLLAKLKDSNKVEITVTGFASPLAANEYNQKLTSRRVSSIENHFRTYKNGQFKGYMDKGMLVITEKASGEDAANQSISDDRKDVRNSWYSPSASSERRVEITNVTVARQ